MIELYLKGDWQNALAHLRVERQDGLELPLYTQRYAISHIDAQHANMRILDANFYDENADALLSITIEKPLTPNMEWL